MYCAQGGGEVSHTEQEELDTAMDRKQQLNIRTDLLISWNQFLGSSKVMKYGL
jgi:hypothetical protein